MKQARRRTEIYHRARPAERPAKTERPQEPEQEETRAMLKAAYIEFMDKLMPRMSTDGLHRLVDLALEDIR